MRKALSAALVLALAVAAAPSPSKTPHPAAKATAGPKLATPPPEISHVVSRPFCTALRRNIGPAIGAILQNDGVIAQAPPLFKDFNIFNGNGDTSDPSKQMTLMKMENTVGPQVNNIAAVEKYLHDDAVFHDPPRSADEKRLLEMRDRLEDVLAMQKASLDITNGFVTTQQLGDIQHAGEGIVSAINGDVKPGTAGMATPTPNPFYQDANAAGLPQDSHFFNAATVPGLTLGYNPLTRLLEGLQWTRKEAKSYEDAAAKPVIQAIGQCGGHLAPPAPTPTPIP
jgi:hypothetical protein